MKLCRSVYEFTQSFPKQEMYGLTAQMRRAAVAIPSNLAEGRGRGTRKDYRQFVIVARGSAAELETQVILAKDLGFLDEPASQTLLEQVERVLRMLYRLAEALSRERQSG
jgi:four helix bundle protein